MTISDKRVLDPGTYRYRLDSAGFHGPKWIQRITSSRWEWHERISQVTSKEMFIDGIIWQNCKAGWCCCFSLIQPDYLCSLLLMFLYIPDGFFMFFEMAPSIVVNCSRWIGEHFVGYFFHVRVQVFNACENLGGRLAPQVKYHSTYSTLYW